MKVFKKFAAFILVAALVFSIFPGASVLAGADSVPRPNPTYLKSVMYNVDTEITYFVWERIQDVSGYELWYRLDGTYNEFEKLATIDNNVERIGVYKKQLDPTFDYEFEIRSYIYYGNNFYYSSFSTPMRVTKLLTTGSVSKSEKPDTPKLKVSVSGKTIKFSWNKVSGAEYYEIIYMLDGVSGSSFKELTTVGASKTSTSIKTLDTSKTYKFRLRAYKIVNNTKVYSDYSPIVYSKKTTSSSSSSSSLASVFTVTLKKGATLTLSAGSSITWKSSKTSVATVSKGVVKAKAAGTAVITASSGSKSMKIKVVVK